MGNLMQEEYCQECHAFWHNGQSCQENFYLMGYWELEIPVNFQVHHLMVLSYHLQHPRLYSPRGLQEAKKLLIDFLEKGLTPTQIRRENAGRIGSDQRKFKIKGTPDAFGVYQHPVLWTMTASDVVTAGINNYCASVRAWAFSILVSLRVSNNMPPR